MLMGRRQTHAFDKGLHGDIWLHFVACALDNKASVHLLLGIAGGVSRLEPSGGT